MTEEAEMLKAIPVIAVACALLASTGFRQTPAQQGAITIFPTQERTITIYRNGAVVGVRKVPNTVGVHVQADGGVLPPSAETGWHFVAQGNGEIRLVDFPLPDAPRSPERLRNAIAAAPVVLSFKDSRVTVTGPANQWQ